MEVYHEIRRRTGEKFPIAVKLNSADFQRGGFTEEDSMKVLKAIDKAGIDLIEISGVIMKILLCLKEVISVRVPKT